MTLLVSRWKPCSAAQSVEAGLAAPHLARRPLLDDLAAVDEDDAVGDLAGESDLVRHDDEGRAELGEVADHVEHFADEFGIDGARRFVEEQHLGLEREGAGDSDALLLTAGELAGVVVGLVVEPHPVEKTQRQLAGVVFREPLEGERRLGDVLERGEVREEVEVLKDDADLGAALEHLLLAQLVEFAAALLVADQLPVDGHRAGVDRLEVVDGAQQRRLARTARAEDRDDLAGRDREVDAAQHLDAAVALVHAADLDEARRALGEGHDCAPVVVVVAVGVADAAGVFSPSPRRAHWIETQCRARCSGVGGSTRTVPRA